MLNWGQAGPDQVPLLRSTSDNHTHVCVDLGSRWGRAALQLLGVCGMAFAPVPKPLAFLAGVTGAHVPQGSTQRCSKTRHTFELILSLDCDRVGLWCAQLPAPVAGMHCAPALWVQKYKSLRGFYRKIRRARQA